MARGHVGGWAVLPSLPIYTWCPSRHTVPAEHFRTRTDHALLLALDVVQVPLVGQQLVNGARGVVEIIQGLKQGHLHWCMEVHAGSPFEMELGPVHCQYTQS